MTSLSPSLGPDEESTRDWGYALVLLAAASAFFLALRFSGRAFIAPEFEILVIYVPTLVCLLIYATKIGHMIQR
ncbi:MAG TPA: hypothetical protein VED24_03235 [Candidatus Acidoferrum sp.]|nr:hypothetical protein [Candidatus Acidoferrum sp.]